MDSVRKADLERMYANSPKNIRRFVLGDGLPRTGLLTNETQAGKNLMRVIRWLNKNNSES